MVYPENARTDRIVIPFKFFDGDTVYSTACGRCKSFWGWNPTSKCGAPMHTVKLDKSFWFIASCWRLVTNGAQIWEIGWFSDK